MTEGISKTFDAAIRDFLIQAQVYKEDLEGLLDQARETATSWPSNVADARIEALEEAIELVEQAIDAVEALPD